MGSGLRGGVFDVVVDDTVALSGSSRGLDYKGLTWLAQKTGENAINSCLLEGYIYKLKISALHMKWSIE